MSNILVTGGAGYIGSHTVVELIQQGHKVIVVDNLSNSSYDCIARIEILTKTSIPFYEIDLVNYDDLVTVFKKHSIKSVIHFAGLKAVGESGKIPLTYYHNNIVATINLLKAMQEFEVKNLVFSSSATVYGEVTPEYIPIPENCPLGPTNPYGRTKLAIEEIIRDVFASQTDNRFAILRYFNPIGAHPSGLIGEDPLGIPNNLLPFLAQVAIGRQPELKIFGSDYDSKDGTPIRDYIHVMDLARGHISALNYLTESPKGLCREWNLGTGRGSTVFDIYESFTNVIGKKLPYEVVGRRTGDVLNLTADPSRANSELKWKTELDVVTACKDLWNWTTKNPYGYIVSRYHGDFFSYDKNYASRVHSVTTFNGNFEVAIANYGATIVYAKLNGVKLNTGFDDETGYKRDDNRFFGATIGRVANRVGNGKLEVNGTTYYLPLNEKKVGTLHGGYTGYDKRLWWGPIVTQDLLKKQTALEFSLVDEDGTEGFPGDLNVTIRYTITDVGNGGELGVEYEAQLSDSSARKSTAVSMTNHQYWNISGGATIAGTQLTLVSNKRLEVNDNLFPTGKIIKEDKLDSSNSVILGKDGPSFDNCFITAPQVELDTRKGELQLVAEAKHPDTKIKFKTFSTEPSVQFYTGDYLDVTGVAGPRAGFCLEAARYIYHPKWFIPLNAGELYGAKTVYRFETY